MSRVAVFPCGLLAWLVACSHAPPGPAPHTPPAPQSATAPVPAATAAPTRTAAAVLREFERQQRAAAVAAQAAGQPAQALRHWDVVVALAPQDASARHARAEAAASLETKMRERLALARSAQARGDLAGARQGFLDVLALDVAGPGEASPERDAAADALRAMELGRAGPQRPRALAARPAAPPAAGRPARPSMVPAPPAAVRADLEHAALLARQGDLEGAIAVLELALQTAPAHPSVRDAMADLHHDRARALEQRGDDAGARAAAGRALALRPDHAGARALLGRLGRLGTRR